jgi:hypothetical protein
MTKRPLTPTVLQGVKEGLIVKNCNAPSGRHAFGCRVRAKAHSPTATGFTATKAAYCQQRPSRADSGIVFATHQTKTDAQVSLASVFVESLRPNQSHRLIVRAGSPVLQCFLSLVTVRFSTTNGGHNLAKPVRVSRLKT